MSHPMWVRGLKYCSLAVCYTCVKVAPHVGAWIEILCESCVDELTEVAPHVGAWIEMLPYKKVYI